MPIKDFEEEKFALREGFEKENSDTMICWFSTDEISDLAMSFSVC